VITEEERQSIIDAAVEKALLLLPEVVGNLIMNQAHQVKLNRDFYKKYPEFSDNKEAVSAVLETVDRENPGVDYEAVLEKAVPLIKQRLSQVSKVNLNVPRRPQRRLSLGNHGEL